MDSEDEFGQGKLKSAQKGVKEYTLKAVAYIGGSVISGLLCISLLNTHTFDMNDGSGTPFEIILSGFLCLWWAYMAVASTSIKRAFGKDLARAEKQIEAHKQALTDVAAQTPFGKPESNAIEASMVRALPKLD